MVHTYSQRESVEPQKVPEIRRIMRRVETIRFKTRRGANVSLRKRGGRRSPGPITVRIDGDWKGTIDEDGLFSASPMAPRESPMVTAVLRDFSRNPRAAVVSYGRETGNCAICGRGLTNPRSVARGIGPICAGRWGL